MIRSSLNCAFGRDVGVKSRFIDEETPLVRPVRVGKGSQFYDLRRQAQKQEGLPTNPPGPAPGWGLRAPSGGRKEERSPRAETGRGGSSLG